MDFPGGNKIARISLSVNKPYLPALSSSRFPAALYVFVYHVVLGYHVIGGLQIQDSLPDDANLREGVAEFQAWCSSGAAVFNDSNIARNALRAAPVTLSFFFTLSGFVLAYTYLERTQTPPINRRHFWALRFSRVYPVYGLALVVTFPIFVLAMGTRQPPATLAETIGNGLAAIFLVQSWSPYSAHAWNPPGWSLSCEAFFYLLFPWIAQWVDRRTNQGLFLTMGWMWVFSLLPALAYELLEPDGVERVAWTTEAFWLFVVKFNPLLRLPEFVVGIALGKFYLRLTPEENLGGDGRGVILSTTAIAGILAICATSESFSFLKLHNGLLTPLFALMIYGLARGGGPIAALFRHPWLVLCGDATYALYILHYAVITYLMVVIAIARGRIMGPIEFLIGCVALGLALSVFVYLRYEVPVRKYLRRRLNVGRVA